MIIYENIAIIPATKEHVSPILCWINDMPATRVPLFYGKLDQEALFSKILQSSDKYFINIVDKKEVGFSVIYDIDWANRNCKVYFFTDLNGALNIENECKCLYSLAVYCFNIGLNKISANILSSDAYLKKIYEKIGFKLELRKRSHLFLSGQYHNVDELAILNSEFKK